MSVSVIAIRTPLLAETIIEAGAISAKALNLRRARAAPFAVLFSETAKYAPGVGAAFLAVRVDGIEPSPAGSGFSILFDRHAYIELTMRWPSGHRNPVTYMTADQLGLNPDDLDWQETGAVSTPRPIKAGTFNAIVEGARRQLSELLGVSPTNVEIVVTITQERSRSEH